ncbi:MAG: M3 family oligoendopeptidase [Chloroflexota bacterium]
MNPHQFSPTEVFVTWNWPDIQPIFEELRRQPLHADSVEGWLAEWSQLHNLLEETFNRLYVATTCHTDDKATEERFQRYLQEIFPYNEQAEQTLKERFIKSGLTLAGLEMPLRNLRAEADLYCEENIPLLSQEKKMITRYDQIIGGQSVIWKGEELPLPKLQPVFQSTDRGEREEAWRLASARQLEDKAAIDELWREFVALRRKLAEQRGLSDYRTYRWQQMLRLNYTPQDCQRFHAAVEEVVLPAVQRITQKRGRQMGLSSLRPWDMQADPLGRSPLRPCQNAVELKDGCARVLRRVHPRLGEYFDTLIKESLLDLENRKGKAPGGYCIEFPLAKRPFIFMNAVGNHDDVLTLVHEGGHAFHAFEQFRLPYHIQLCRNLEFMEVASTAMEYLTSPYLERGEGGFYTPQEAARAMVERLENVLLFLPYMTVVDAFQHWVYEHPERAESGEECDRVWGSLWQRYMKHEDWSGLEREMQSGWQRKLHIHEDPFYYIEYGLAELGAVQIWMNAQDDQPAAVERYLYALGLGGTETVPRLYEAAGVKLIWEKADLQRIVQFVEDQLERISPLAEKI